MPAREPVIGIDLGTSYSCVAVVEKNQPMVIPNEWGEKTHASVVSFLEDGRIQVGNDPPRTGNPHAPEGRSPDCADIPFGGSSGCHHSRRHLDDVIGDDALDPREICQVRNDRCRSSHRDVPRWP